MYFYILSYIMRQQVSIFTAHTFNCMTQIQKYTWLINTLRNAGRLSYQEISARWERNFMFSEGNPLPRATFNRWREDIRNLFQIEISCQRTAGNLYYIENPDAIEDDAVGKYILDSISAGNLIYENRSLKDRIVIDCKPSGYNHLPYILSAMKENRSIKMTYQSFEDSSPNVFLFEPYCVKLFENRWYVLGRNLKRNVLLCYGLDRILDLTIEENRFKIPQSFSADKFYHNLYGIVSEKDKPKRIVLRAYGNHAKYLASLPLHHSQQTLEKTEEYTDFELFLVPEYDFIMRLLHDGALIEVLQPLSLRKAMKGWITDMYELYEDTEK